MTGAGGGGRHPYASPLYAQALAAVGRAIDVPEWGSFVLARPLPAGDGEDGAGAYPMAVLEPDSDLSAGLARLRDAGLVTLVLVPDPLTGPSTERLAAGFGLCRAFKTHHLIDLAIGPFDPSKHHRDRIRRGRRRCRIESVALADTLDAWTGLYAGLVERRSIGGPAAFDRTYFEALSGLPQLRAFAAFVEERLCAMTLWFSYGGVAYNHLTASNADGYANGANFALYDAAIRYFEGATVNLGGGAGHTDDADDGLAAFKRGFANASVQSRLCGAVLDAGRYGVLNAGKADRGFFPAYRG